MPNSSPSSAGPDGALEQSAREHLAAGRWRKAREDLKQLCKKERAKFQPLLIEANVGLARDMIRKGLNSEAEQVLAYLKTIAPPAAIKRLEFELATRTHDQARLVPFALELLAANAAAVPIAEKLRCADQLVIAFAPTPVQSPAEKQIAADVQAVHDALEAISQQQFDRALDSVRPIGRDSAFSHWKLFVKGLAAFHRGESEKAAQALSELPANSVPSRARAPYLVLLGKNPDGAKGMPEAVLEIASRLTGHTGWRRQVAAAELLWRKGEHIASYRIFRDALPSFPSEDLNLAGILSEFYFKSIFTLDEDSRYDCADFFIELEVDNRAKNPAELQLICRTFCLLMAKRLRPRELKEKWEKYLQGHEKLHGKNSRLASLAYAWLGEQLARPKPKYIFDVSGKTRLLDPEGAIDSLEKSIELDPANAPAHILLCSIFESEKRISERNRLLDRMTERFPANKDVLVRAGVGCIDRNAFLKGLDYFERAMALDRIDPTVPDFYVLGCLRLARHYFENARIQDGRKALDRVSEFVIEQIDNFVRSRWCYRTHRGVFEQLFGDAAHSVDILAQARAESPFPAAFFFLAQTLWRIHSTGRAAVSPFQTELTAARKDHPNTVHAATLLKIWKFWRLTPDAPSLAEEERWLQSYLNGAADHPVPRGEADRLIDLLRSTPNMEGQALKFISNVLKNDREDPLFRLYKEHFESFRLRNPEADYELYNSILEEATRRGDAKAVQLARELVAELDAQNHRPDFSDLNDESDQDADYKDDFGDGPDLAKAGFSPDEAKAMAECLTVLGGMSDAEIEKARKTRPKDMPKEIFDMLVTVARSGGPPTPRPLPFPKQKQTGQPGSKTPAPAQPPLIDPNQLNLF